jgi:L,D-peptidoglycan transpeptidase YkuD (ErfK/YbiS/YcfS/YnhG family)
MTVFTASAALGRISGAGFDCACVFGKAGLIAAAEKREGDKASPMGLWPVRRVFYRADRIAEPAARLRCDPIEPQDGWCDAPGDPGYNRLVRLPYPASCETLMRQDGLYDLVVVLGHNDDPPIGDLGSAIFLHCRAEDGAGTAGCVAAPRDALSALIALMAPGDGVEIKA